MKWIVITLLAGTLSGMAAPVADKAPPVAQGNRYLFVVETSTAMSRLPHAGRQAVFDMVFSGLENHMRPGDTFGLWTFQDEVMAGEFPIQVWEPENKLELASRVGKFLKSRRYKNKPVLDNALARVGALVRTIKDVNVIFVCSPEARPKEGRPFAQMASLWLEKEAESRKAKKPLILTLAMEKGEILQRGIALAGDPLELPMPRPQLAVTNANTPASAATNLQARATRPNIIMQRPPRPKPETLETAATTAPSVTGETNAVAVAQRSSAPPPDAASAERIPLLTSGATTVEKPTETKSAATVPVPQQVATVTPAALSPTALILAGSGLMAVGLTVGAWLLISSRKGPQLSSISQSMSRVSQEHKNLTLTSSNQV